MKKSVVSAFLPTLGGILLAGTLYAQDNGQGKALAKGQEKPKKVTVEQNCEGVKIVFLDENGNATVKLPMTNPKALENWRNQWARKNGCPETTPPPPEPPPPPPIMPLALVINDLENASETIVSDRGVISFVTQKDGVIGNTLGYLWLAPFLGRTFVDGETNTSGFPLSAFLVASYQGTGDLAIQAGETVTITYDGGKTTTFTFPQAVTVTNNTYIVIFTATLSGEGKLFWDAALTNPL